MKSQLKKNFVRISINLIKEPFSAIYSRAGSISMMLPLKSITTFLSNSMVLNYFKLLNIMLKEDITLYLATDKFLQEKIIVLRGIHVVKYVDLDGVLKSLAL